MHSDSSIDVDETIATRFNEERRGIIRSIPILYDTGKGFRRNLQVDNLRVTADGGSTPVKIWSEGDNIKIRTGEETVFYPPGTKRVYRITYTVRGALNWFEQSDWEPNVELYWNLTGNEWDTNIETASFLVKFPDAANTKRVRVYHGSYGSQDQVSLLKNGSAHSDDNQILVELDDRSAQGTAVNGFNAYVGWTVVLSLPTKLVPKPTPTQEAISFFRSNPIVALPLVGLVLVIGAWFTFGRDPKPGPMVVQFDPPDHLTAAQLGALLDDKIDKRDLAAAFVQLAHLGYLTMHVERTEGWFQRDITTLRLTGKPNGPELSQFEQKLMKNLRDCKQVITEAELRKEVGPVINELHVALFDSLIGKGYYNANPTYVRNAVYGIAGALIVCGCCGNQFFGMPGSGTVNAVSLILTGILVLPFASIMPRRTPMGAAIWNKARGFEQFIQRARSDELDWISKKAPDQALYEEFLPYAVAMGLTHEWTDAFKNIDLQMPDWYEAPRGYVFQPYSFVDSLGSSVSSAANAAATPPRSSGGSGGHSGWSSGGGGGGFSGGGFGGGGGSSW